jgi:hypothetical protein
MAGAQDRSLMRPFSKPLIERQLDAERMNRRYRTDPEFRLHRINRARAHQGLPPRASLDDVRMRVPMEISE